LAICLGSAVATPSCASYCNAITTNCVGSQYYSNLAYCMSVCPSFPLGNDGDTSGNTVGCRTTHALLAANASINTQECLAASATGGNVCGDYCEAYCNMSLTGCTIANGYPGMGFSGFQNMPNCMTLCSDYIVGDVLVDQGNNTLACRLYHAQFALETSNLVHCTHQSPNGGGVCGQPCDAYCNQVTKICPALNASQYLTLSACSQYCLNDMNNRQGNWNDTSGDTIGCRIYHSDNAQILNAAAHCAHAGPSGDNVCGSWCTVYCDLVQQNCIGSNTQYSSPSVCMSTCATMNTNGNPGDVSGNTVQCRIYHAGVAGNPVQTNAQLHCPHAGPTGGGVCGASNVVTTGTTGSASSVVVSVFSVIALIAALAF